MTKDTQPTDGQFQSLLDTVERLRKEHFPHLDAGLVREVLRLHSDAAATAVELTRSVEQVVERRLTKDN
jgi:hypothetical protein